MEEWVIIGLYATDTLQCDKCGVDIQHQEAHMYVNVDHKIEEVLCEKCWEEQEHIKW